MAEIARIRVTIGDATLELEGTPDWIGQHSTELDKMLERLTDNPRQDAASTAASQSARPEPTAAPSADDFGEILLSMPKSASATDQMLLAGWFAQQIQPDNTFATRDASTLLLEQGVKVGNPSQCMTNNLKAKRVFKVSGGYRVAKAGAEYLDEIRTR